MMDDLLLYLYGFYKDVCVRFWFCNIGDSKEYLCGVGATGRFNETWLASSLGFLGYVGVC